MVRLVITDFATKEDSENFYINEEFDVSQNMFTYKSFKKYSTYLPKYSNDKVYSLNLLSRKYLEKDQFLIHIADGEYIIRFNHKTIYSAKINANFITDDMIKSILITKHIAMLSSGGTLQNIYYIINAKYKAALENILQLNIKNDKKEIISRSLGDINELVKPLTELDSQKTHVLKLSLITFLLAGSFWILTVGLKIATDNVFYIEPLDGLRNEVKFESQFITRQENTLNTLKTQYNELTDCITHKEALK